MKTKIVLGLGLCLLLTVINLQRAMDNYGITDAKFKVGVLADESSSSGPEGYLNVMIKCIYYITHLDPYEEIRIFDMWTGIADANGACLFEFEDGEEICIEGGGNECDDDLDCRELLIPDVWSISRNSSVWGRPHLEW